jgi:hypothetical protein
MLDRKSLCNAEHVVNKPELIGEDAVHTPISRTKSIATTVDIDQYLEEYDHGDFMECEMEILDPELMEIGRLPRLRPRPMLHDETLEFDRDLLQRLQLVDIPQAEDIPAIEVLHGDADEDRQEDQDRNDASTCPDVPVIADPGLF